MIVQFFKKNLFLVAALMFVSIYADNDNDHHNHHHHKQHKLLKSHHIQVLINPADPSSMYNLFNGSSITSSFFAPRPAGGYYYLNGLIFPKKTINPLTQNCFNFDTHGNPLTEANSVGTFRAIANQLVDVAFNVNFPAKGTIVEDVRWDFYFNEGCGATMNNMSVFGQVAAGTFAPNSIGFQADGMSMMATICNGTYNCVKRAKVYFNNFVNCTFGPQILIEIEFENDIFYTELK
jgi:hypothetical protein